MLGLLRLNTAVDDPNQMRCEIAYSSNQEVSVNFSSDPEKFSANVLAESLADLAIKEAISSLTEAEEPGAELHWRSTCCMFRDVIPVIHTQSL